MQTNNLPIFNGSSAYQLEGETLCFQRVFDTRTATREEWLQQRTLGLGSSDASVAIGVSKYKSRLALYFEKFGMGTTFNGNEYTEMGNIMEDTIAHVFMDRTGLQVRNNNFIIQSAAFPFMRANLDREGVLPDGRKFVLEIKNSSQYMADNWENGNIPDEYLPQLVHQLIITGYDVGIFGVLVGGNSLRILVLDRNYTEKYEDIQAFEEDGYSVVKDLKEYHSPYYFHNAPEYIELVLDSERDFQNYIEHTEMLLQGVTADDLRRNIITENVPPLQGTGAEYNYLLENHPVNLTDKVLEVGEEYDSVFQEYKELKERMKIDTKREKELKALIVGMIGDNTGIRRCTLTGEKFEATWKAQASATFDQKALISEYPAKAEEYTSNKPILDKKALKKDYPDIYSQFQGRTRVLRVKSK